jgi:hypothetical protein
LRSSLDFLIDYLSFGPDQRFREKADVRGSYSHMKHDYNFSLLQTLLLVFLIGGIALGGLIVALAILGH